MSKNIKEYLNFSATERTGIILLLVVMFSLIAGDFLLHKTYIPDNEFDYSEYKSRIDSFRKTLLSTPDSSLNIQNNSKANQTPFFFDPNKATINELEQLGINKNIARRILTYRNKGGCFKKKEDLMKIHGFDSVQFALLYPYIKIQADTTTLHARISAKNGRSFTIELNTADTTLLKKLQGIGSVLSLRIIKYRELLGGYFSVEQLQEVYGISDSLFRQIKPYLKADTTSIKKIQVNKAVMQQLSRHPYIGEYMAQAILAYRKSCGTIKSFDEFVTNKIIPASKQEKLKPYFSFE